ncbi:hypothetical protein FHS01_000094 [Longimicrobium terrae]|uniref:Uncharacterized protein n=1 Tax=Longimicrobium terrae TaxID=1639882 RepID=A0A841GNX4_9BACT|nr:hypothetical protein [Longimicrobium terrae]MBB6069022.1 hypothetical protein [Longimicrobium terrae]
MNYVTVSGTASHVNRSGEITEFRVGRKSIRS